MPNHLSTAEWSDLTLAARAAAANAYVPYSHFAVGAALLLDNGERVTGCNVENASYRLTCCAEQTALVAAVARFGAAVRVRAVAVQTLSHAACTPCGACRQMLAEFADGDAPVLFPAAAGLDETRTLAELLPASFELTRPIGA